MLFTANKRTISRTGGRPASAAQDYIPQPVIAPVGGWDASNPLAAMPPENAVELVNWFPQPGYVELRRGFVNYCDTASAEPVETLMGYQGEDPANNKLFAISGGDVYDVTSGTPAATTITGLGNSRIQKTMFANGALNVLWCCNGADAPFYFDGTNWTVTAITGVTGADIVNVCTYRNRIWGVIKNTTKACYLGLNAITGAAVEFDVGAQFPRGGELNAIVTWSTSNTNGPQEYIGFISTYGDIAVYLILDPTNAGSIYYLGTSQIGSPIGRRCSCKFGSDTALVTIDGVVLLSMNLNYDRAVIQAKALTSTIRTAMTQAARVQGEFFGWQLISYPRNTMAILNVPVAENNSQEQFVQNTVTGAWCRFNGQYANCWEIYENRAYFGDNDGIVNLADESACDENATLFASMRGAFNPYGDPGHIKQWEMILPIITIDSSFPVVPQLGLNIDFEENAALDPIEFTPSTPVPLWNDPTNAVWDQSTWPGNQVSTLWQTVNGVGRYASIRLTVSVEWSEDLRVSRDLQVNSFNVIYNVGGAI